MGKQGRRERKRARKIESKKERSGGRGERKRNLGGLTSNAGFSH